MSTATTTAPPPVITPPTRGRWGLLRQPNFRKLWIGETTSGLGTAVGSVALSLVAVVSLHASPFMVGVLNASAWLPWLFLGLVAGAWVDRLPHRTVMLACDVILWILFASVPVAAWLHVLTIAQLVLVAFLAGTAKVFFNTAYLSIVPSLVDTDDVMEANVKLGAGESAVDIAGPGLAGLIAQALGASTGILADALSYLVSAFCLRTIKQRPQPARSTPRRAIGTEIAEGIRFVRGDALLRTLTGFGAVGNLALNGIAAVQTVYLARTLHLQSGGIGAVFAFVSIGGFVGASVAGRVARRFGTARGLLLCYLVIAPFILLLPLAGAQVPLIVSALGWSVAVCGVVAGNVIAGSFYQIYSPPEMIGRIRASASTVNFGAIPVGALLGGYLGGVVGTRATIWIMAAVLMSAAVLLLMSPIRTLRDFPTYVAPMDVTPSQGRPDDEWVVTG